MPATPLFHPGDASAKQTGRLGRLTKREAASLATLKQLVRKQGLSLGLVRGPGEQNDVCLLRFLRAQGFEEKRVSRWSRLLYCKSPWSNQLVPLICFAGCPSCLAGLPGVVYVAVCV